MLVATALAGRREHGGMANAERVKDAAEAGRSGYLLVYDVKEVVTSVEGAMP